VWQDFKKFAFRGNVIDLAIAVVIGAAFSAIVKAIVDGLIMPIVGAITPGTTWETWTIWRFRVGHVASAIVNFLIVAFVLYVVVSKVLRAREKPAEPAPPPEPSAEAKLLTEIRDLLAKRAS
jgi:large conductance mechanosensitive channel